MGAIVIRTRYDEGTESAEVATSADVVWDNKILFLINKLENVQIEAARIVTGGTRLVSINSLHKETGLETLQARRENHQIFFFL